MFLINLTATKTRNLFLFAKVYHNNVADAILALSERDPGDVGFGDSLRSS